MNLGNDAWCERTIRHEHAQRYRNLVDLYLMTQEGLENIRLDPDLFFKNFGKHYEFDILRKLPSLEELELNTHQWIDDTSVSEWLYRLETAVLATHQHIVSYAQKKQIMPSLLQSVEESGKRCASYRWSNLASDGLESNLSDMRTVWSAFRNSPFFTPSTHSIILVKRLTRNLVLWNQNVLFSRKLPSSEILEFYDFWTRGFIQAVCPQSRITVLSHSPVYEQKWEI